MTTERHCARCGAPLASVGQNSLCPGCLLEAGVEPTRDALPTALIPPGAIPILARDPDPPRLGSARRFGNYEILDEIARGGMGVVDRARQIVLDRLVAVKMWLSGPRASPDLVRAGDILTLSGVPVAWPALGDRP